MARLTRRIATGKYHRRLQYQDATLCAPLSLEQLISQCGCEDSNSAFARHSLRLIIFTGPNSPHKLSVLTSECNEEQQVPPRASEILLEIRVSFAEYRIEEERQDGRVDFLRPVPP